MKGIVYLFDNLMNHQCRPYEVKEIFFSQELHLLSVRFVHVQLYIVVTYDIRFTLKNLHKAKNSLLYLCRIC